jgi:hypothetical protein
MYSSQIVRNPSNRISRWMVAVNPESNKRSALILKGRFPAYLFEVVPPTQDPECITVMLHDVKYFVKVRQDFDKAGTPPQSYLIEMLTWYTKHKYKPTLKTINAHSSN